MEYKEEEEKKRQTRDDVSFYTQITLGAQISRHSKPHLANRGLEPSLITGREFTFAPVLGLPKQQQESKELLHEEELITEKLNLPLTIQSRHFIEHRAQEKMAELNEYEITKAMLTPFTHDDLENRSVVTVNRLKHGGLNTLNDKRMGVISYGESCLTCSNTNINCPGHYGIIRLNEKLFHPLYYKYILQVLTSVCNSCGGLLMMKQQIERFGFLKYSGDIRLGFIANKSKGLSCMRKTVNEKYFVGDKCVPEQIGEIKQCIQNPEYINRAIKEKRKIMYFCKGDPAKKEYERLPGTVFKIFDAIDSKDAELLGFQGGVHPKDFILRSWPVMPPCTIPPNYTSGIAGPNILIQQYKTIITENNKLHKNIKELSESERDDIITKLKEAIHNLIVIRGPKLTHKNIPQTTIESKIKGKTGIRGFLMGKRADYTGRSVITPNPNLKFGQIGIPEYWKKFLTIEVTVTNFNKDGLTKLLRVGKITHIQKKLGGNKKLSGKRYRISESNRKTRNLEPGDIVHRYLQNGDMVIANRQPTLHKGGMMAFEVVLLPGKTIQLNLSVTPSFNADFDGDEINIHVPQTLEALADIEGLLNVKKCIINPLSNKPNIGIVYDNLTAAFLLTRKKTKFVTITINDQPVKISLKVDVEVDVDTWNDCLMLITSDDGLYKLDERLAKFNVPKYTGRALFSALLPPNFLYEKGEVMIIDGILIQGTITKKDIGLEQNSIIQELHKQYGEDRTSSFINDGPFVLNRWLIDYGFSIGLDDCSPKDPKHAELMKKELAKIKIIAEQMAIKLDDPLAEEQRERRLSAYLNMAKSIGSKVTKDYLTEDNSILIAYLSGAKGSPDNVAQISTSVAQQHVGGKRLALRLTGGKRWCSYFAPGDTNPEARGFCPSSFLRGLSLAEFFAHATSGREGLLDTAIKTAETGSLHHRIGKLLEDIKINYDGSVRDHNNNIIQFIYGDDGFDPAELQFNKFEGKNIPFFINIKQTAKKINASYGYY